MLPGTGMASQHFQLSGEDLARPAEDLPLKAIRDISYKLHRALSNSGNWETIAEELGYDWEEIKHFQAVAAVRQDATPCELMLQEWRQKGNGRTLYVLHDALRAAGRSDCVELLEKEIYEKLVCMDLRVGIKYESNKLVEHKKVRTRMEATLLDSLQNLLEPPVMENYQLLDHSASWTQTLAKEFRGRELMLLRCTSLAPMEQDPTIDSSSSSACSPSNTSPADGRRPWSGEIQSFQPSGNGTQRAASHCRDSISAVNNSPASRGRTSPTQSLPSFNNLDRHGNDMCAAKVVTTPMNIPFSSISVENESTLAKQVYAYQDTYDIKSDDPRCNAYHVTPPEGSQPRERLADIRGHEAHTASSIRHNRRTELQSEGTQLKAATDNFGIRRKLEDGFSAQNVPQGQDKMAKVNAWNFHSIEEGNDGSRHRRSHRNDTNEYREPEEHCMYRDSDYCAKYRHSDQFKSHAEYRDPADWSEYRDPANIDDYRDPEMFPMHPESINTGSENDIEYRDPENIDEHGDPEVCNQASADDGDSRFHLNNTLDDETAEYVDSNAYRDPCEADCLGNMDDASISLVHSGNVNRHQVDVLDVNTTTSDYQLAHVIQEDIESDTFVKEFVPTDMDQTSVKGYFSSTEASTASSSSSTCVSTESSDREMVVFKPPEITASGFDQTQFVAADAGHPEVSCGEEMQTDTDDKGDSYYMDFNKYPQDTEENCTGDTPSWLPCAHASFTEPMTSGRSEPFQRSQSTIANVSHSGRNRMEAFKRSQSTAVRFVEPSRCRREVLTNFEPERQLQSDGENEYESLNRQRSGPAYSSFSEVAAMDETSAGITIADVFSPQTEEFKIKDFEMETRKATEGAVPTTNESFDTEVATTSFKRVSFDASTFESPSRSLSMDPESRSLSLKDKSLQAESLANQRKFFKQRNSLPNFSTNFDRPPLRQSTSVYRPPHPYKLVIGGKTSRPSLDQCLVGDNIFAHYNKVLKGYIGWCPKETENTVIKTMADTLNETGYYVLWYWRGKRQLIISISHRGKLENFRVFTKVLKEMGLVFYIYKEQKFQSIIDLLTYYSHHGLNLPTSAGSSSQQGQGSSDLGVVLHMRCPVIVQYDKPPALSV